MRLLPACMLWYFIPYKAFVYKNRNVGVVPVGIKWSPWLTSHLGLQHMRHQLPTTTTPVTMIHKDSSLCNMGRGAYDTTGVPKPPPRPQPR